MSERVTPLLSESFNDERTLADRLRQVGGRLGPGLLASLVLLATFAVGLVAGVAVERRVLRPPLPGMGRARAVGPAVRLAPMVPGAPVPSPQRNRADLPARPPSPFIARFARDLELTAAQRAAVDSVIAQEFAVVSAIREEAWPRVRALVEGTRVRIDSLLTPAQRERYRAMLAEQQQRIERIEAESRAGQRPQLP